MLSAFSTLCHNQSAADPPSATALHYDRTAALIQRIAEGVETDFFFGCIWDCVLCNPAIRLPAITFTLMKFNKKLSMEDQLFIMGTDLDVTVSSAAWGYSRHRAVSWRWFIIVTS